MTHSTPDSIRPSAWPFDKLRTPGGVEGLTIAQGHIPMKTHRPFWFFAAEYFDRSFVGVIRFYFHDI